MVMAKRYSGVPVCCEECDKFLGYCDYNDSPINCMWCEECEGKKTKAAEDEE